MSFLQLLLKPKGRSLIDVLSRLPNGGVGARVTRSSWEPYGNSYWEVTAVKPRGEDGTAGKAWGVRVWRGVREEGRRKDAASASLSAAAGTAAAEAKTAAAAAATAATAAAAARRIPGRAKRVWRWQPTDEELARLAPLLQEARRREAAAAAGVAAAAGEGGGGAAAEPSSSS